MKRLLLFTALLCIVFTSIKAQQGLFKLSILPGHTYSTVNTTHIKEDIDYTGDTVSISTTKKTLQPHGFEISSVTHTDNKITQNNNGPLLFTMIYANKFISTLISRGVSDLPQVSKVADTIYGKYKDENKMEIDSITDLQVNDRTKAIFTYRLQSIQPVIHFPSTPLKVGNSFVDSGRINGPGAGLILELQTKTTYKLTAIENEKAFFDTETIVHVPTKDGDIWVIKSEGTGKMVYDMGMNYPIRTTFSINVNYVMTPANRPNLKQTGKLTIASDQQNTITF